MIAKLGLLDQSTMSIQRKTNKYLSLFLFLEKARKLIKERFNKSISTLTPKITFDQYLLLNEINELNGINQKTLSNNLYKEVASVSRLLVKLQRINLVIKKANPKNLREFNLYLTAEGAELLEKIEGFNSANIKSLFTGIYEQEFNLAIDVMRRMGTIE